MGNKPAFYSISQVAEMTGLTTQLIRKWEQRYRLIQPERMPNGYRVYTQHDVDLLQKVSKLVQSGFSVKNAVLSVQNQHSHLRALESHPEYQQTSETLVSDRGMDVSKIQQLLALGERADSSGLIETMQRMQQELGIRPFLYEIVVPFLQKVGTFWKEGVWSEYQEHIASGVTRDVLIQMRRTLRTPESGPLLLAACVPYERHEIPLHMLMIEAALEGWRSVFLGPSPAEGAIETSIVELQPVCVALSMSTLEPVHIHPTLIDELSQFAAKHANTTFFFGGRGAQAYFSTHSAHPFYLVQNLRDVLRTPNFF
ncbi:MerR family transcriptional regulator [Alicyclobacillus tolerans]|uniref:MerR HTH family regulatory protein n=1 Tax=Alicyclobacillus tolerans TaxID=90970 RepID=A0A1M6L2S2_9BACL|nr:MerR family transcriptional regulator [Alicyclobacillus montanus]SHJ65483.1 MerR HTH family regulatory protein [Alicyclobacillus montanus]